MLASPIRARLSLRLLLIALLAVCCSSVVAAQASAAQTSPALRKASKAYKVADRAVVSAAKKTKACERRKGAKGRACATQRAKLQKAGTRLARAQRKLAKLGRRAKTAATTVAAPSITVSGTTLKWNAVGNTSSYVFVTKVLGTADKYSVVSGTSFTPPAVPGKTVRYSVRASVNGSAWAKEVSITYPSTPTTPTTPTEPTTPTNPTTPTTPTVDTKAAPSVSVSGTSVTWSKVGSVDTYVLVRKVPGSADQYSAVSGTSTTPAAAPGKTVRYSVRTAVEGSAWAPEVSITYPTDSTTPTTPTNPTEPTTPTNPTTPPPTTNGSFSMGLVAGSALTYEYDFIKNLGSKTARLEFTIGTSVSSMRSTIDLYARNGIRPLLLASFYGRIPSSSEAQNLGTWAKEFGPNGTFWQGKSYPASVRPTEIEFGNETSYSYQFSDTYGKGGFGQIASYQQRAKDYAVRAKEAAQAIKAANTGIGLIAIGEPSGAGSYWVNNMFAAVPDLGSYVSGWTIHPYGPDWQTRLDQTIQYTEAKGAPKLPLYITEWGLATDNGRCLDDNYGFDKCMTYSSAASTLRSTINSMKSRYGSRLREFYLYQAHDQRASGATNGREHYFGALKDNNTAKGDYTNEVKSLLAAN